VELRNRRIWYAEVEAIGAALDALGAWQAALRVRTAHDEAVRKRPDGTAFLYRPTPEDVEPLDGVLATLRAREAHTAAERA
jgi:hypothetical protein